MAFGNAELDKLKGVERAEHALNHSDLDRPKHYFYDPELPKNTMLYKLVTTKPGEII